MKRIGYGIVGAGFVGPHHIEAVRRLGFVQIVALADANLELARRKAEQLFVPRAYGSYEELIADPEIAVVDIATPTWLHHRIALAAIAARKHVIVDKPMATTAAEAREMLAAAREAGVVNAVTFNYRYNPVVQQARVLIHRGDVGQVRFVHGHYMQEWLMHNVLTFIAEGRDPASADGELFPMSETGYRVAAIVDAAVRSQRQGSRWVEVDCR